MSAFSTLINTRVTKLRRVGWAGHVARRERKEMHKQFWWENLKKTLGTPNHVVEDNIKMYSKETVWGAPTGLIQLRI
jgi:hypothetical protein